MKDYPIMPVNTPEQEAAFMSIYIQRDRSQPWTVCLAPLDDDRSEAQNRLMWHWNREAAAQLNLSADWVHGESKMSVLLPLMKAWGGKHLERADHVSEILECLTSYKLKVSVSYDKLRTKKHLGVKHMTAYLNEYQRYYVDKGLHFTTSADYDLAMGLVTK